MALSELMKNLSEQTFCARTQWIRTSWKLIISIKKYVFCFFSLPPSHTILGRTQTGVQPMVNGCSQSLIYGTTPGLVPSQPFPTSQTPVLTNDRINALRARIQLFKHHPEIPSRV